MSSEKVKICSENPTRTLFGKENLSSILTTTFIVSSLTENIQTSLMSCRTQLWLWCSRWEHLAGRRKNDSWEFQQPLEANIRSSGNKPELKRGRLLRR